MRIVPHKWLPVFILFTLLVKVCCSQQLATDSSSSPAFKSAVALYNATLAPQLHLFNGKQYHEYAKPFSEGHPYFITNTWATGTVIYDGNRYENVSIMYNLVTDALIILNYQGASRIQLIKEKVNGFTLSGHSFIHLTADSLLSTGLTPGFYEVLTPGKTMLLARRTKNIQTYLTREIELKVFAKDHYYVRRNNTYVPISNKDALLGQLQDKGRALQQYIKDNRLNFKKNPESAMAMVVAYYNQLVN